MAQKEAQYQIDTHIHTHAVAVSALSRDASVLADIHMLARALDECASCGGVIYVAGNGGFGAVGQHFATELTGRFNRRREPVAAVSLSADAAVITCIANDYGFEQIFSRQLAGARKGDIFIGLTASGRSKNILEAVATCRDRGVDSFILTGNANSAQPVDDLATKVIHLPADSTPIVQELGMIVLHAVAAVIDDRQPRPDMWDEVIDLAVANDIQTLMLDRDGVINRLIPNGYVLTPEQFIFNNDFLRACPHLAATFDNIFIVTNQRCVGKGMLGAADLELIHQKMLDEIEAHGGRIDGIYCSVDADKHSTMSKPETGLADCIGIDFPSLDLTRAIMVGDSATDQLFAERIGCKFIKYRQS